MADRWVFSAGFWLLFAAIAVMCTVLRMQYYTFAYKSSLQPLKRLLFGSIFALVFAAASLMLVYGLDLWSPKTLMQHLWLINVAVLGNALSKLVSALLFYVIYKYDDFAG